MRLLTKVSNLIFVLNEYLLRLEKQGCYRVRDGKKQIDVFIKKRLDVTFDVYFGEQAKGLTFGLLGQGDTVKEAIADFHKSKDEIEAYYIEIDKPFPNNLKFALSS